MGNELTHLWKVDPHTGYASRISRVDNDMPSFVYLGGMNGFNMDRDDLKLNASLIALVTAAGVDPAKLNILVPKANMMELGTNPPLEVLRLHSQGMGQEIVRSCIYPTATPSTPEEAARRASRVTLMGFSFGAELMESVIFNAKPGNAHLAGVGLGNLRAPCAIEGLTSHSLHVYSEADPQYFREALAYKIFFLDSHPALIYAKPRNGGLVLVNRLGDNTLHAASLHTDPDDPAPGFVSRLPRRTPDDWQATSEQRITNGHDFHLYTNANYPDSGPRIIERKGKDPLAIYASLPSAAVTQAYFRMAVEASFADTPRDMPALLRTLEATMLTREKRDFLADECAESARRLQHLLGNDFGR